MRYWGIKNNKIKVTGDQVRYSHYYAFQGAVFDHSILYIPVSAENILAIMKNHPHDKDKDVYSPAFVEAAMKCLDEFRTDKGKLRALSNINMKTIDNMPLLIKHKEPKPFKNQKIGLYWTKKFPEHGLMWEMGVGKTRTGVETFILKYQQSKVNKCLVICPVSMLYKWVDEVEKWSDFSAIALDGTRENKQELLNEDYDFYVINYESLTSLQAELLNKIDENWMIIGDETTKIKNPYAKRSKSAVQIANCTKHKIILTGTPVTQNAYDLFNQFQFLDGGETFGLNYDQFIDKYFWKSGFKVQPKYHALEQISDLIYKKCTRFRKEECIDIPEKIYDIRKVHLTPYMQEVYDAMVQYAIAQIQKQADQSGIVKAPIVLTQLLRLSQITSGFVVDVDGKVTDFEDQPKLKAVQDIMEESVKNNGNKLLVWARFQHDVEKIMKLCKKLDIWSVDLYGEVDRQQREVNIKAFQTNNDCKVMVGTAGTGGFGIELTAANVVVYYSNSYSLEQRLQSEDRTHRAGLNHKIQYIDLLADKTIDVPIYKILKDKKKIADLVTRDSIFAITQGQLL